MRGRQEYNLFIVLFLDRTLRAGFKLTAIEMKSNAQPHASLSKSSLNSMATNGGIMAIIVVITITHVRGAEPMSFLAGPASSFANGSDMSIIMPNVKSMLGTRVNHQAAVSG
jgi:hypothetical protein